MRTNIKLALAAAISGIVVAIYTLLVAKHPRPVSSPPLDVSPLLEFFTKYGAVTTNFRERDSQHAEPHPLVLKRQIGAIEDQLYHLRSDLGCFGEGVSDVCELLFKTFEEVESMEMVARSEWFKYELEEDRKHMV